MTGDNTESIKQQIINHTRRLNILKEKKALDGKDVAPQVIIEIEDIEAQIKALQVQLPQNGLAEVILDEDPDQFSKDKLEAARRAFAAVLEVPIEEVRVAFLRAGSVVLLIQLPKEALERLVALNESGNPTLQDLRIQQIKVIDNLTQAELSGIDLSRFDLFNIDLRKVDFSKANLREVDFRLTNLSHTNLSGANLGETKIDDTTQIHDKWRLVWKIVNQGAKWQNLSGADLRGANLSGTNLSGTDLRGTDLSGANLSGTDLSESNLNGANLSGADLRGANLSGTDLRETDLRTIDLSAVISDERTKWPWQTDKAFEKVIVD